MASPSAPDAARLITSESGDSADSRAALRLRPPRSLPPWIDSYEERYGPAPESQLRLLNVPAPAVRAQHNSNPDEPQRRVSKDGFVSCEYLKLGPAKDASGGLPHFLRYGRASMRGRKWDHLRTAEPVIVPRFNPAASQPALAWHDFLHASAWGRLPNEESEVVDYKVLEKLQPSFGRDDEPPLHLLDSVRRQRQRERRWRRAGLPKRVWNSVMRNSLSPLLFRLAVVVTSVLALGIATCIFQREDSIERESAERTQAAVAVAVDCVAIPYIGYMLYDEYTGKPVGLRSGFSKVRLILLDLFFIIFKSASTALAFESLVFRNVKERNLLNLSTTLGVFELVGLISWSLTFTVNILRTVERLGGGSDSDSDGHASESV